MKPKDIAVLLALHELHTVQAVKPYRTLWRCACGHEVDASTMRHQQAQAKHQAQKIAAALRKEDRARTRS